MIEQISKRQEANLKIASILLGHSDARIRMIGGQLKMLAEQYPQQRAGQIICNYLHSDYRDATPSVVTQIVLEELFPGNPDPFFEESVVTLKRLMLGK